MKKSIGSGRGSVYNILLKALQSGDKYGYEICKEVEEKTNGTYILKQASLYSGLKRLEAQGDITSYWRDSALGGRRHYYSLTEKGRDRINRSNFSWTDARDDIVESLFEKSEIEKEIENVTSDIEKLKETSLIGEQNSNDIDEILEKTENLVNQKDSNNLEDQEQSFTYAHPNTQSDDLFSMFSNYNYKEKNNEQNEQIIEENNDSQNKNSFVKLFENESKDAEIEKNDNETADENLLEIKENIESINKSDNKKVYHEQEDNNFEQLNLFSFVNKEQNNENEFNIELENKQKTQNIVQTTDFNEVINNLQTIQNNNIEDKEKILEENKINFNDENIDKIELHFEKKLIDDDANNISSKTATLQKNQENIFDEYISSRASLNRFSDSTQYELPEKDFSNYISEDTNSKNNIVNFEKSSELSNSNTHLNNQEYVSENIQDKFGNEEVKIYNNLENSSQEINENQKKTLDYRDIFGDLMSNQADNQQESNSNFQNSAYVQSNTQQNEEHDNFEDKDLTLARDITIDNKLLDDLPRNENSSTDINRTLIFDKKSEENQSNSFESYDNFEYNDNPFEKYDTYAEPEKTNEFEYTNEKYYDQIHNVRTKNLSFDKKFANDNNNFYVPDYDVKYFKKYDNSMNSKYVSINKLNLIASSIMCIIIYILTTLTIIITASITQVKGIQTALFIISYIASVVILIFDLIKYLINKHKKTQNLNSNERVNNIAISIILIVLSVTINIIAGLNIYNLSNYIASFFVPLWYSIVLLIKFPLKKFLSKFANFYK